MKSFLQFITEAVDTGSKAVQQATRMGLVGDGHGGWYKDGEFVAKTKGRGRSSSLIFFSKRQTAGQDPAQTDQEKKSSAITQGQPGQAAPQAQAQAAPQMNVTSVPAQQVSGQEAPLDPLDPAAPDDEPAQFPELEPNPRTKGSLTIAFGRFNPPHAGHDKLMSAVADSSEEGEYVIVPTKSEGKDTDPLDFTTKVEIMKDMFPQHSDKIVDDPGTRTIFDVLKKAHADGYSSVKLVGGSDREKLYSKLSTEYNGRLFDFDSVETINAGERDENSDDAIEALSASVQRQHVKDGDFASFYGNLHREVEVVNPETGKVEKDLQPIVDEKKAEDIYLKLRKALKKDVSELWQIAPRLDWKNLRENYIKENIFKIGQLVESFHTGLIGRIIRRGTNYLICVTEDKIMFKSWIQDVTETKKQPMKNVSPIDRHVIRKRGKNVFKKDIEGTVLNVNETVVNGTIESGVKADNRLVGTDALRKYAETMNPKSEWGRQFLNKYRKK